MKGEGRRREEMEEGDDRRIQYLLTSRIGGRESLSRCSAANVMII